MKTMGFLRKKIELYKNKQNKKACGNIDLQKKLGHETPLEDTMVYSNLTFQKFLQLVR